MGRSYVLVPAGCGWVERSGFRVEGSGFRDQGLGC